MKKMIFHIPMRINTTLSSGSEIRPQKMIQAFKDIGYAVDIVMGYVKERRQQIKEIKQNIKNGIKYDFLYSESSTMPTALTEKHHLPIAPFLDFDFFRFCRDNHIKIGLFYRDIYWVFKEYKEQVPYLKYKLARFFYKFDLKQYQKTIDIFYLPSIQMYSYVPFDFNKEIKSLPPAIGKVAMQEYRKTNKLNFIYVGGLGQLYNLTLFSKVVSNINDVYFNLCTRKNEWIKNKDEYSMYIKNTEIHHKNGLDLTVVYKNSDIAIYFVKTNELWSFAMGVKLFEYLAYKKPIIAVKGTAVGDFVQENDVGWVIDYDEVALKELIHSLQDNPLEIEKKVLNIEKITAQHTWKARAKQVQKDLMS